MSNFNEIIEAQVASNVSRDLIIITLVTEHKLTLNAATKAYGDYAKANGMVATVTSHKAEALEWLADTYTEWDHVAVANAVIDLVAKYDIAESTARDYTKAYSKDVLGIDHPKLDPRAAIFDWFKNTASNYDYESGACKEAFTKYATEELGRSKSNANEYWKGYELHMFLVA